MNVESDIFSNLWAMILVLLFFGGSIFIHEFGHYLAAKMCGLKVLRFSIGFGPALFSWRGKDGCDYMVCALPLGGYVALPQLADMGAIEGSDGSEGDNLPKATCFQKIVVSAAGAFFNLLLALALAVVVWIVGFPTTSSESTTTIGYVSKTIVGADNKAIESPAYKAKLRAGDKIISVDGANVSDFMQVIERIAIGSGRSESGAPKAVLEIERNGAVSKVDLFPELVKTNPASGDEIRMIGVSPAMTMKIGRLLEESPALKAGAKVGDTVVSLDGVKLYSNMQLSELLAEFPENKSVTLGVIRDGKPLDLKIVPEKIALTKSACEVALPDGLGTISFIAIPSKKSSAEETIKVLSVDSQDERFKKIHTGDILYEISLKRINSLSQLNAAINSTVGLIGGRMSFSDENMNLKTVFLPQHSTSKILPPKEKTMLGYMLDTVITVRHPTVTEQFKDSISRTYFSIASLLNPKSDVGIASLAGPVDIGRVIYRLSLTDISLMLSFAVLLNINLAILNMLPIPVLDGGHIMFAIIEKIRGKPLSRSFFTAIQSVFSLLFLALMVYVVYLGFLRWDGDSEYESSSEKNSQYYIQNISFKKHE